MQGVEQTQSPVLAGSLEGVALSGRAVGKYRVVRRLAEGGMGEVLLGEDTETNDPVVIKQVQATHAQDPKYRAMFQTESNLMAVLRHPNIVRVLTVIEEDPPAMIMEFIDGPNLAQLMAAAARRETLIAPGLALLIARDVLQGLSYAHNFTDLAGNKRSVIHRDITPANVLISSRGKVVIIDFGIAKAANAPSHTAKNAVKGTTRYLSPEQISGHKATVRSDLYAVAVLLSEMLFGRPLFGHTAVAPLLMAIAKGERPDMCRALTRYPGVGEVLEQALSVDADRRFPTADAFLAALEPALRDATPNTRPALAALVASWGPFDETNEPREVEMIRPPWESGDLMVDESAGQSVLGRIRLDSSGDNAAPGPEPIQECSKLQSTDFDDSGNYAAVKRRRASDENMVASLEILDAVASSSDGLAEIEEFDEDPKEVSGDYVRPPLSVGTDGRPRAARKPRGFNIRSFLLGVSLSALVAAMAGNLAEPPAPTPSTAPGRALAIDGFMPRVRSPVPMRAHADHERAFEGPRPGRALPEGPPMQIFAPEGASVQIDGRHVGRAPLTIVMDEGTHSVRVRRGRRQWKKRVTLDLRTRVTVAQ